MSHIVGGMDYAEDIFSERTLKVRRNLMISAVVTIFLAGFEGLDLKGLNLFGISLNVDSGNEEVNKNIVVSMVMLLFFYNVWAFYLSARKDLAVRNTVLKKTGNFFATIFFRLTVPFAFNIASRIKKYLDTKHNVSSLDFLNDLKEKYHRQKQLDEFVSKLKKVDQQSKYSMSVGGFFYLYDLGIPALLTSVSFMFCLDDFHRLSWFWNYLWQQLGGS